VRSVFQLLGLLVESVSRCGMAMPMDSHPQLEMVHDFRPSSAQHLMKEAEVFINGLPNRRKLNSSILMHAVFYSQT